MTEQMLITGARGWLGLNLQNEIMKRPEINIKNVTLTDLLGADELNSKIRYVAGDLARQEQCKSVFDDFEGGCVIHLAGLIHPKKINELYYANTMTTENVLAEALRRKAKKVIVISSNSAFGAHSAQERLNEDSSFNPYMKYGEAKAAAEQACLRYRESGLNVIILRGTWFYGPFQPARQSLFFKMIKNGKAPLVGGGDNLRSMTNLVFLSKCIMDILVRDDINNETFWVADKHPYKTIDIIKTIRQTLEVDFGVKCKDGFLKLPGLAADVAYAADYILQLAGHYHQKIHVLSEMNKNIACRVDKIEKALGVQAPENLVTGMRESIAWCFKNDPRFLD